MAINSRIRNAASELRGYSHQLQFLFGGGSVIPEILASIGEPTWRTKRVISVDAARAVVAVGPVSSHGPAGVVKISRSRHAAAIMVRERTVLSRLRSDPRLDDLRALLPDELAWGRIGDEAFVVESALPGIDARNLLDDPRLSARLMRAALDVAAQLHERTSRTVTVDVDLLARWVEEPLRRIARLSGAHPRIAHHVRTLEELGQSMTEALLGRRMVVSWLHGDFFPGNILVTPDAMSVTGLVDWDLAAADELPVLDATHFVIGAHLLRSQAELGQTVIRLLDHDEIMGPERASVEAELSRSGGDTLSMREAVILTWLRHIGWNLQKSAHFSRHRMWVKANVEAVLESLPAAATLAR